MKFSWKHWLSHFITWLLLLVLIGCNIWLIKNELKKRRENQGPFFNYRASKKPEKLNFNPPKNKTDEEEGKEGDTGNKDK